MAALARIFVDSVLAWYRRRILQEGARPGRGGAIVVLQRTSSDLRLNPHLHVIFLDGVFVPGSDDQPVFRALPRLSTSAVADVLQIARVRIIRHLERRGLISVDPDALTINDDLAQRDPALARLAAAAVSGLPPAGVHSGRRRSCRFSERLRLFVGCRTG